MTLENTFYVLGIIFMILNIAILVGIVVGVFFIKKKIEEIQRNIEDKIATVKEVAATHTVLAEGAGAVAMGLLSFGLKKIFKKRK